jgi:hydrogenase-4 component F
MLILIPALPLAAVLLSLLPLGKRVAPAATLLAAIGAFVLTVISALDVAAHRDVIAIAGWVQLDGFGATILLVVTFLSVTAALFSWGYVGAHAYDVLRVRSYFAHFNLFTFSLALVPVLFQPALVWIAVEFTSIFSVLLVAFDNTHTALEAAWKYIALMFMGAAIALLGFFVLFWAQEKAGGGHYSWDGLRAVASQMPPVLVMAAFLLILVGLGVKVGFVPLHTWLPDAHSQAPAPVCALLSGIKTTNSLYVILRLVPLLPAARIDLSMQIIGLISAGVAAFLLLQVRDYKRLFAYSTVEHLGIIFVAAGFGGGASGGGGSYAALLQIVSHSVTKSFCFLAAGAVLLIVGTREIAAVRGLIRTSGTAGAALLVGALAIGGAPPFGVFLSEFAIFRVGLEQGHYVVTALLALFITVAFFGILMQVNRMVFGSPAELVARPHATSAALPFTAVLTLIVAGMPVLVLGLYQPAWLNDVLTVAASNLTRVPSP